MALTSLTSGIHRLRCSFCQFLRAGFQSEYQYARLCSNGSLDTQKKLSASSRLNDLCVRKRPEELLVLDPRAVALNAQPAGFQSYGSRLSRSRSRHFVTKELGLPRSKSYHVRQFCSSRILHLTHSDSKGHEENKKCPSLGTNQSDEIDRESSSLDGNFLDNDPELKSIIEDIKQDFAREKASPLSPRNTNLDSEPSELDLDLDKDGGVKGKSFDEFEFDYSVAEDIEEYDYIDESEIGQHEVQPEKHLPISLQRGQSGVFDLEELLLLLDHLGGEDIVSFPVPPEARYCDHMVIVSAKSRRHLQAINEEMLYVHKRKKSADDPHLLVEGINKSNWCAMDMGNIVLHMFHGPMREYYDIESLWTLGRENGPKCKDPDQDPYALSAEDLFWLETAKSRDTSSSSEQEPLTSPIQVTPSPSSGLDDNDDSDKPKLDPWCEMQPGTFSDKDAGWGDQQSSHKK